MISIPNWRSFQHYGKAKPPWIKLYRDTLQNFEIMHKLKPNERWVLVGLWMLAATHENKIPSDLQYLSHALREKVTSRLIDKLQVLGMIEVGDESRVSLEEVYAQTETETETEKTLLQFEEFWEIAVKKVGKLTAERAFTKALKHPDSENLLPRWRAFNAGVDKAEMQFVPHPATWLNQGRWLDGEVKEAIEPDEEGTYFG